MPRLIQVLQDFLILNENNQEDKQDQHIEMGEGIRRKENSQIEGRKILLLKL